MIKNIITTILTTLAVLLVVHHPIWILAAIYFSANIYSYFLCERVEPTPEGEKFLVAPYIAFFIFGAFLLIFFSILEPKDSEDLRKLFLQDIRPVISNRFYQLHKPITFGTKKNIEL